MSVIDASRIESFLGQAQPADYRHCLAPLGFDISRLEADAEGERAVVTGRGGEITALGRIRPTPWDSDIFGVATGRIEGLFIAVNDPAGAETRARILGDLIAQADRLGLGFLDCRIRGDDPDLAKAMRNAGFRLCDELSVYQTDLDRKPGPGAEPASATAAPEDIVAIIERGLADMTMGRVFADPMIAPETARRFYREASRQYLSEGAHVTTIEADGQDVGAAIGVVDEEISRQVGLRYGFLWFIVVDPAFRAKRIGTRLFDKFKAEFAGHCDVLEIGTQTQNAAANRIYATAGCRDLARVLTFHRWATD